MSGSMWQATTHKRYFLRLITVQIISYLLSFRPKKQFGRKFDNRGPRRKTESADDRIKSFVIRNSRMGFFTKLKTVAFKLGMTEDEALMASGFLLSSSVLECVHDRNGEIKLCEAGKREEMQQQEYARIGQRRRDAKNPDGAESGDRPNRTPYSDRPNRTPYSDRPNRDSSRDRPARPSYRNSSRDRPERPSSGDRPARPSYRNSSRDRPERPSSGDRPARPSYRNSSRDRPERPSSGDRPARPSYRNSSRDRPERPSSGDRPARPSYRNSSRDRPERPSSGDRPARPSYRNSSRDRPERPSSGDRPARPSYRNSSRGPARAPIVRRPTSPSLIPQLVPRPARAPSVARPAGSGGQKKAAEIRVTQEYRSAGKPSWCIIWPGISLAPFPTWLVLPCGHVQPHCAIPPGHRPLPKTCHLGCRCQRYRCASAATL